MKRWVAPLIGLLQATLAVRVVWRLVRTGREGAIQPASLQDSQPASVAVIVPVLNEATRLTPCLEGLCAHGPEVGEILIVDGGSTDATCDLVRTQARRDHRIRLVEAGSAAENWNGKVWGLAEGERALRPGADWVLTLDADVRPSPALARSLVAHAERRNIRVLSVATNQQLSGAIEGLLHPALLATLVYRFGRPGTAARSPAAALANGQCCLIRRDLLHELGGFRVVRASLCEDVSLARLAARGGDAVGFYEAPGLIDVAMYRNWREAWQNWPRSLTTRDAHFGIAGWLGLLEVLLVQALPLAWLSIGRVTGTTRRVNVLLLAVRVGMLIGMARAYPIRPWTYWLSPLLDVPAAFALWRSAVRWRHTWRGRTYVTRQKGLLVGL